MRRAIKTLIVTFATLFIIIPIFVLQSLPHSGGSPADFYGTSREVSLNETINVAKQYSLSIYLPSELPNDFERTAIYLKDSPFIAIVVYSAEGNKDYKTAELVIQISPGGYPPTYSELESIAATMLFARAIEINSWPVLVNEKASTGGEVETKKKWGDYFLLVTVYMEGISFSMTCPTLTTNEAILIVENLYLLPNEPPTNTI
ncbi:MAG TPA: hypothetical protein ENI29_19560 [bacterium]|nr:hypothetical protein [bacterium]